MLDDDYFNFFDIPISFRVDLEVLKKKYYKLSRLYHPDHFTMEPVEKQQEVLVLSDKVNTAYKVLADESLRMKYILEKYDMLNGAENQPLNQDFLIQMMEINEQILDLQSEPNPDLLQNLISTISVMQKEMKIQVDGFIDDFENQRDKESALKNIKEYYFKTKYLLRIRENISTFALS